MALLTQHCPEETSVGNLASLRYDAREYVMSCATCQKIDIRHKAIRESRVILSILKPMQRIAMDTIGPQIISKQFEFILVIIDTFKRYVELYPITDVTASAATDALWRHSCRFGTTLEIMTDYGSQLIHKTMERYALARRWRIELKARRDLAPQGILNYAWKWRRYLTPLGIRQKMDECVTNWPEMLCMTEIYSTLPTTRLN